MSGYQEDTCYTSEVRIQLALKRMRSELHECLHAIMGSNGVCLLSSCMIVSMGKQARELLKYDFFFFFKKPVIEYLNSWLYSIFYIFLVCLIPS